MNTRLYGAAAVGELEKAARDECVKPCCVRGYHEYKAIWASRNWRTGRGC